MQTASTRERLEAFAALLERIRAFFRERAIVEVTTPALSPAGVTDPMIDSVRCEVAALGGPQYLQTSPEYAMKRLLAAGSGDIWQLARVFRDGELGRWHQPEFLLLEWYRVGFGMHELMDEVHALLSCALGPRTLARLDLRYADAFADLGVDPHSPDSETGARLTAAIMAQGIGIPDGLAGTALLDLALVSVIVPAWPASTAVFLYDYPISQAALAAVRPGSPPVAERFEVFVDGIELGNGFRELTDASEQRRRFLTDLETRRQQSLHEPPLDEALLAALEAGLPPCAGVAIGLDRLFALARHAESLRETLNLPHPFGV